MGGGFEEFCGTFWGGFLRWDLKEGGYLGIGIGGEGDDEVDGGWSFGGGVEGREEKRFRPCRDARITIDTKEFSRKGKKR